MKICLFFFAMSFVTFVSAQKTISKSEFDQLKLRMDNRKSTKLILDSLWSSYKSEPFVILGQGANSEDGLIPLFNLYRIYYSENPKCSDCEATINKISSVLDEQSLKEQERQYIKILNKAEELFLLGEFPKAKEFYQRALIFRATDTIPMNMLVRIDAILANQMKLVYTKEEIARMNTIADAYFVKKDYVKSKQFYSRTLNVDPSNESAKKGLKEIEGLLKASE
jgi:tetratricopeptide (TPR) repeat protein